MNPAERGRTSQRGAAALMVLVLLQLVFLGGCAVAAQLAGAAAATHATTAADAVAHAAVAALAADPARADFEIALQGGAACALADDAPGLAPLVDGDDMVACHAALQVARDVAGRNRAHVISIRIGADPQAFVPGTVPARFEVVVEVEVAGPLRDSTVLCRDHQSRRDLCWSDAWSAAREAG